MTRGRVKALVLVAWSGFFSWLLVSGQVYRYIGSRTYWVVIFGAICLTAVSVAHLLLAFRDSGRRVTVREGLGFVVIMVPILLVSTVPGPSLGSLAASRKITGGITSAGVLKPSSFDGGEIGFQEISYAAESAEYAASIGLSDGWEVDLTGFVNDTEEVPKGTLPLTRFSVFCCAADAVPYTVPIRSSEPLDFEADTWLRVRGVLVQSGDAFLVEANSVEPVEEPRNPYI